jgi:hypothetical protein
MKKIYTIILSFCILTPVVSFALLQGTASFLTAVKGLMNPIIAIMSGLAVIYFFWGMGQFILHAGDPKAVEEGRSKMIWGVVAIFVIFCIFGIINWLGGQIGITPTGTGSTGGNGSPCALGDLNCGDGTGNGN